jgi:hypothetical protein
MEHRYWNSVGNRGFDTDLACPTPLLRRYLSRVSACSNLWLVKGPRAITAVVIDSTMPDNRAKGYQSGAEHCTAIYMAKHLQ